MVCEADWAGQRKHADDNMSRLWNEKRPSPPSKRKVDTASDEAGGVKSRARSHATLCVNACLCPADAHVSNVNEPFD